MLHVIKKLYEVLAGCWKDVTRVEACQTSHYTDGKCPHAACLIIQGHKESLQPVCDTKACFRSSEMKCATGVKSHHTGMELMRTKSGTALVLCCKMVEDGPYASA